jgi:hypothetical protein
MSTARLHRVSNLLSSADRLLVSAKFYSIHMETLRVAAAAWPNSNKALRRYQRLAARWRREADRLVHNADRLMAERLETLH